MLEASYLPPQILGELKINPQQKVKIMEFEKIVLNSKKEAIYAPPNCHYNNYLCKYLAYVCKADTDIWDLFTRYIGSKTNDDLISADRTDI